MKKKEIAAIAKFSATKHKAVQLNGITVDFSTGVLYASTGVVLVKAKYLELQQNGPKVTIPINTVLEALKVSGPNITITPEEIGGIVYQPIEGDPPDFEKLIPENNKPGLLPWCEPENLMKVEKLAKALDTVYGIRLPEKLSSPVRFDFTCFGSDAFEVVALVLGKTSKNDVLNWRKFNGQK